MTRRILLSAIATLFCVASVHAADPDSLDAVATRAQSLIANRCRECHGTKAREGGLRFLSGRDLLVLNDSGVAAVVPGQSAKSELVRRVESDDKDVRMPPKGDRLSADEIAILRSWVDQGARWPQQSTGTHWSYLKPVRPALPAVKNTDWPRNELDHFVLAKLEQHGLQPSEPTDKARLLRRVSLDLIGLPPTPGELDAFLKDDSPSAFERVVDRLLKSPRYGERWARPWLDMARYADSNGYQADQFRTMWAYRDWVINAMNADMPFDQFTIEQIAGDLLPKATIRQKIATGFHRCPTCNVEAGVDPEENRVNQIVDRVNTTATVWLGTTLECAQCHNHKYDPFTQQDYYQLFSFFNNTPMEVKLSSGVTYDFYGPTMDLPLSEAGQAKRDTLTAESAELDSQLQVRRTHLKERQAELVGKLAATLGTQPEWHVLTVKSFASVGGVSHELLEDQSILVSGKGAEKDTYTVVVHTDVVGATGFKLEALTHDSLPGKGPGRQSAERPNFVLNEFTVAASPKTGDAKSSQAVSLHSASASYAQKGYAVDGAVDGKLETAWAIHPEFHKSHHARFLTTKPVGFDGGTVFTFQLVQNHGGRRTIGRLRVSAMTGDPGRHAIPQVIRDILAKLRSKPVSGKQPGVSTKEQAKLLEYLEDTDATIVQLRKRIIAVKKELDQLKPETTLVMVEMDKSRTSNIFKRGNFLTKGAEVQPDVPAILHGLPNARGIERTRETFARWLVDRDNPLVARVTVNRWWAELFGRGIVSTVEDFGTQGEPPTHPRLLDWLAVEFMEHGWSMKHIHKTIVMSAAYQQSSRVTEKLLAVDPFNKLLTRGPRFRLPAETIRDNALTISGLLSTKMHGPPIFPPQPADIWRHIGRNAPKYDTSTGPDRFRRGIYVVWRRSAPYPNFVTFDAPDRASCVVERSRTNTPLQALAMLNDPAYVEMTRAFAARVIAEQPLASVRERIDYAFRLCVARKPTESESRFLERVHDTELARFRADTAAAERLIPKSDRPKGADVTELATWFHIGNVLLNLDETISKN